jgi:hypothetical protein
MPKKIAETRFDFPYEGYAATTLPQISLIATDLLVSRCAAVRPVNSTSYDSGIFCEVLDDLAGTQGHDEMFGRRHFLRG